MPNILRKLVAPLAILLAIAASAGHAAPVVAYQNTDADTGWSIMFSAGYTQIGDRVQLAEAGRLDSLETQFFNAGADASFDAELRFYSLAGPTPVALGTPYLVSGIVIGSGQSLNVGFGNLGGLAVPDELLVMLSVLGVSTDGDIGLNFFDPPSVGTSNKAFFMANDGTGIAEASTLFDVDNLHLRIVTVPEPSSSSLVLLLVGLAMAGRRRRAHGGTVVA